MPDLHDGPAGAPAGPPLGAMRAITIRQPWATMIAEGVALAALERHPKMAENRGRRVDPRYWGQDWALHAGATFDQPAACDPRVIAAWPAFAAAMSRPAPDPRLAAVGDLRCGHDRADVRVVRPGRWFPTGAVVAVATLVNAHPAVPVRRGRACCAPWGELTHQHGRTPADSVGAWHLVWGDVRRLAEPVPAVGQVMVPWELTGAPLAAVLAQLA